MPTFQRVFTGLVAVAIIVIGFNQYWMSRAITRIDERVVGVEGDAGRADSVFRNIQDQINDINNRFATVLESDSKLVFALIDADLESVERSGEALFGSYSDSFVLMLVSAQAAGASPAEINRRLDRVLELAKRGKFFSSSVRELYEDGELEDEINDRKKAFALLAPKSR